MGKLLSWPAPPLEWIGHTGGVNCTSYSPDGGHIISGSDDSTIRIWDVKTGTTVGEPLKGHSGGVYGVSDSPNGRQIFSGSYDGTIQIWDAETGDTVGKALKAHKEPVWSVAYSPNGWYTLWIVVQVEGTGHQSYQVREPTVTYWVNRWEPPAIGDDPPGLPPSGDLEKFQSCTCC